MLSFICSWDMSGLISKLFPAPLPPTRTGWPGICGKYFISFPQKNLSPEKLTIKSWAILKNLKMLEVTKTPILPNFQVPNSFFVNLIIQELKFCKLAQFFIVSVSLGRGFSEGTRENIFHIFRTWVTRKCRIAHTTWRNYIMWNRQLS